MSYTSSTRFPISTVERETGLSKDTLRKWEMRYGFPVPQRDNQDERLYTPADIERLQMAKQLINQGHRPVKIVGQPVQALRQLLDQADANHIPNISAGVDFMVELVGANAMDDFKAAIRQDLLRQGLGPFIQTTFATLCQAFGGAWANSSISVFQEHAATEWLRTFVLEAIATVSRPNGRGSVLLTTPPMEQHYLGLLMVHALFALEGFNCISLGIETPPEEIASACTAYDVDLVAVSFSVSFPKRQVLPFLHTLREQLNDDVQIWVGGAGIGHTKITLAGVRPFTSLAALVAAMQMQ